MHSVLKRHIIECGAQLVLEPFLFWTFQWRFVVH